ncbi:mucin-5AC-like isoform X1 [Malaclemys terrapin pileata]|uniref:mucin-5AC-like isoform X1 n=1 Tax=Malaclemys terrapin pileata TaxID=2991368 RepID=UPI0023A812B8|nr:mucin-5AC-like isoform X1 [Malaclemys terrapin pileata]
MGIGWGVRIPLWIPILVITFMQNKVKAQYEDQQANYDDYNYVQQGQDYFSVPVTKPQEVTIIQPLRTTLPVKPGNPAHNGRVCSTWGNFHFKTFDGDIFHFPGLCNYVFASHCKSAYEDFNIQIRRTMLESSPVINHITLKLDGMVIELTSDSIVVNGNPIQLPFSQSGILIERSSGYLKITAKMGLVFMWNQLDGLLVELDKKYANQTCGLCGDFNGIPIYNEFTSNNIKLTDVQFGNMQKMDGPTEQCEDPTSSSLSNCSNEFSAICQRVLTGEAFVSCNALVDVQDYIDSCVQDLCRCDESMRDFCICNTFAEYSRQCAHAGGQPLNWRTKELCNKTCPYNMQHEECGSPCANTCTNPERSALCEDHCTDGCVCPPGTVSDDINSSGCIPLSECHCTYKGETYSPGASFASQCTSCTCTGGQWSCVSLSCPGTCSIEGGSHISTFDEKRYSFFGDCSYILTKLCDSDSFAVLGEVRKCGLTDTETYLKGVAISIGGGQTIVVIKPSGSVFVNTIYTQLPISAANVTIFRPSSFFIIVQTNFGLQVQIQLVPIMQLFVNLDPSHKGQTCGLCGNFNNIQADDFKATSGVVEGTAAAFANTWKIQGDCPNVKNIFENPCTLSIENEKYAQHWCGLLTDTQGPFAECHSTVNPDVYHTNCLFDTCNCEKSEDCMCAALSTYVRACAAKGVLLNGWRTNVCTITSCPKSLTYSYVVSSCQPTCRSLSEPDVTCNIKFTPVDGCTCANGTYMDENGKCVPATSCPCYYKGSVLPSGEVVHDNGVICSCTHGKLDCVRVKPEPVCAAPMVYFDCSNVTAGTIGSECQKSCQTLDMGCYSTQCVSGCVCPNGLVSDGKGGCVAAGECPCVHNDASYNPGETIKVNCNTCTCKNRMWQCTNESCLATCSVYGDGHYITFDGKRFSFSGDCEYTLVQDYCGKNSTSLGTFRVITENIPCGTTGTTCSKAIKVFLGNYELVLSDGKFEVIEKVRGGEVPYKVRYMGIYMVIDTNNGLILMWDKKTSIFIKLSPDFKGQVCGLCGNYDGNGINDFTTRSQSVVGDVLEFGNSWKVSPTCPDAKSNKDPCTANPYRNSWAQKQCSIINSKVFAACHSQVEPNEYYEACVTDACACDTGGDCECFCTAVASYAQACNEAGICVAWRTPSICPLFCDYYNPQGECEWHYKPCGSPCMKTCRNRSGKCLHELQGLEGCYPKCPENKPYFDEDDMECVDSCGCYDTKGKYYKPGTPIRSEENCQSCECTMNGIECEYDEDECHCTYDGKQYEYEDVIYDTTDGIGGCIIATCGHNGTIDRKVYACSTPLTTTPFSFSSSTPISTTTVTPTTSVCVREVCQWSQWYDVSYPGSGINDGDFDTFDHLRAKGYKVCKAPKAVECRSEKFPNIPLNELEQKGECSTTRGLICYNKDQHQMICDNFQIKILCCSFVPCEYTTPATTTPAETTTPITKTTTPETTVTGISSTTTALPTTTESKTTTLSTSTMTSKTPSTSPVTETTSVSTSTLTTTAPSTTIPETTASPSTETVYTTGEITSITPCKPKCKWSEWHDVHFPSLDNKGDSETYDDIRAAGKVICSKPENIECRAEKFPEKSIDNIGQIVQCNVSFGLVCRNEDQEGVLQMCYNYQIKVFCCDDFSHCPSTSTTTETTTTAGTTIVSTKPSTHTPITTETTTSTIRTTPSTTTTTETTTKEIKTTTPLTTTPIETTTITTTPFTTTSTETTTTLGTPIVSTETSTLTPTTTETTSTVGTTHSSTTSIETTTVTTTPFTTTTTETTTTPGTPIVSTETSTLTPTTTETTSIGTTHSSITSTETTTVTTTPFTATTTQTTTTTGTTTMTTPQTTTTIPTTTPITSTPIPDTFTTTTTSPTTTQTTEFTTIISTITTPTTTAATTTPISTTKPTSSIIVTTTPAVTTISETTTPVTTVPPTTHDCFKELCEWSQWYDVSYPRSAINGGDFDTFKNIRAKGYNVCKAPKAVECRAERFPNTPLNELEQNVICSKTEGLICYNKDQLPPICYNYQIKIECCRNVIVSCPTTTLATTTTVKSTPPIPTTTPTITPIVTTTPATTTTVTTIPTTTQIVTTTPGTTPTVTTTPATTTILTTTTTILTTTPTITPIGTTTPATTPIVTITPATTTTVTTIPTTTQIVTTTPGTTPIVTITPATTTILTTTPNITPIGTTTPATTPIETTTSTTIPIEPTTTATTMTLTTTPATTIETTTPPTTPIVTTTTLATTTTVTTTPATATTVTTRTTATTKKIITQIKTTKTAQTAPVHQKTTQEMHSTTKETTLVSKTTPERTPVTTTLTISTALPTTTSVETKTSEITRSGTTTGTTTLPTTAIPTTSPIPTTTGTTTSSTTKCQPTCTWSKWFDVDFPSSGPKEGDIETYNNIRAAGEIICRKPENIQCRAENYPDISIDQIGQVVQCDANFGLVCKNEDQIGKFKMCFNYQIRVFCCEENPNCPTATTSIMPTTTRTPTTTVTEMTTRVTTSTKPTVTQTPETTTSETTPITTTNRPSTSTSTTGTTTLPPTGVITTSPISTASPTTTIVETTTTVTTGSRSTTGTTTPPTTEIPTTSPIPTTTGTTTSSTTKCQPTCTWSKWFDVDFPSSGPKEGDIETYNNIRAAGEIICRKPENIQCRAENYPDISIDQIGQVVQCDANFGLVCKNEDQIGKFKMCFNYQIRVFCCEENPNCPTATTSIMPTTTRTPTTTVTETTTRVTTSTKPTVTQTPETTTSETTPITTTNRPSTSTSTTGTTTLPPTGVITTSPISTASPTTTIVETTTTVTTGSRSTTGTTTPPTTEIPTTSPIPTTTGTTTSSTTKCQPTCTWSKWFDVDFPSSGPKEGDIETYNNIRAAGEIICRKPENIQCRAENYPDISIDQIGQVVQCDANFGLVCKNEDQIGKFKMCFNYQIRVFCCEENPNCPTATTSIMPTTTRTPTTTVTETTTRVTTSTKPTVTQTPETTTSETTPITTTNRPSTSTSTTGTTTLPPTGVITTSPISTASPTTTIVETTTTVTTGSRSTTGTTTLPTTEIPTTSPIPTTTGTTTSSTTKCQPTCTWSKWFDVDFPSSGPKEGDIETYNNIRAAGEIICRKPENIQCRAENYPDISIDQIGQVVQCDANFGLVCKNEDQIGKFKMCFNYQIRVFCCEENPNCPTATTSIMPTTTRTPTTTVTETTTRVTTSTKPTVTQTPETTTSETTPITTTNRPSTSTSTTGTTTLPPTGVITTSPISTASPTTTIVETTTGGTTGSRSTTGTTTLPTTEIPTTSPIPTTTGTTTSSTTKCQPTCTWSKWFDVDFPSSGPKEGDIETYNNIRAAGEIICRKPENIQCRAENYPDISIDQIGQVVQCDANFGLVCKNEDQIGKFKMCFNYQIRVFCCEENPNCPTATTSIMPTTTRTPTTTVTETTTRVTTSTKPTVTQTPETTTSETTPITTTNRPSTSTSTTGTTTLPPTGVITTSPTSTASPTTTIVETTTTVTTGSRSTTGTTTLPTTEIPTTSPIPTTTGTTTSSTTKCQPTCTWSKWFDVDFPSSGPKEGDIETYNNIRAAGEIICRKPENIQCRAENYPDISIDQIGQVVQCDANFGLVCKNEDQIGKFKMCFNYQIRVFCCEENPNCPTATTSIMPTTTRTPTTTVTETTTRVTTSTKPTVTQTPETTTSETTPITTTNRPSTSTSTTGTTTLPPTGVITTSPTSTASPTTTIVETTTTVTTGSRSTTGTTTLPTTEIPTTSPIPTTTGTTTSSTTKCQPTCTWSKWFDVDFPSSGPKEGDIETYNNIRAAGEIICRKPENIQCRAENYPDISIDQIGQVVQCDANFGLVCKNEDQIGKFKMCFNYQIRVFCCEENPNCPTATTSIMPTTTRTPTTTVTETTTRVTTSTKPTVTQTPETTTSETTPITTTNRPSTSTSTTGTTTLPPTGVITTSPTSTASPTTTIVETTTTVTTGSRSTTGTTTLPTTEIPTTSPIPTTTGTTTSSTTKCQPTCTWSKWFDVDFPSSGPKEGDIETYNNIRAAGEIICRKPENIQCRAENYPDISIDQIGQVVQCDANFGLVCKNEDQIGKFKMCFNYQIRVFCCEENPNCPTATTSIMPTTTRTPTTTVTETTTRVTTSTKPTVTQTPETTTSETTPITTTNRPSTSTSTTGTTTLPPTGVITTSPTSTASPTTTIVETTTTVTTGSRSTTGTTTLPTTEIPTTSPIPTTTGTTTSSTTKCQPTCTWSKWFDVDFPSSGPKEGDIETYNNIRAAGEIICRKPENIQCRAENYPDISIDQIGQVVQCDANFGLVCKNEDQIGKFKMCFNYQIRVFCCEENPNCPTATTSIMPTTTRTPTTTVTETTTRVTTSTKPTVTQTPETTTSETTPITTTNRPSTSTSTTGTTTLPPTGVITTSPTSTASPTTTIVETTTTVTTGSRSTTGTTTLPTTEIPTTSPIPTTTGTTTSSTTKCQPTCTWSKWFDVDFPSSGPKEGDIETYNNIRAAGEIICRKPENIQCRAENYPDISIDQIGQVVQCDANFGLVCKNEDQIGKFKMCFNYQIRVFCCEENPNCPTATTSIMPTTTRTPTTTVTETTTRVTTSTKPTVTQTPETTTSETTPITTTNRPSTSTSTTGTTTLPPTGVITTSPTSTASPTTTIVETTTTVTTGSRSTTGTTTLPTTEIPTTSPIPTTTGTTTSSTTKCQPTCTWSKWFDVDFPSSGPKEGDIETYNNIRAAGEIICRKPENIQCRAENYPDISIDQIGQVVQCDANFGLVCKNEDQIGKFKMCFNYQIRVFCCDENVNCPVTTSILPTMPTRVTTPTISSTQTGTTEVTMTTTHCFCQIEDAVYASGEMIYNKIDKDGCNFYAICSKTCSVERFKGPCKSTTPATATTTTPTTSTSIPTTTPTTTVSSTTKIECPDAKPPRKMGETWKISNCTTATCEGNNKVVIQKVKCPPVKKITCANGYPPVEVFSEDGCCYHYECECVCSGWGDPHYITFDGTYYTFLDNCTYTLVKQITPKYDNFRVDIDNYFCDAEDGLSCPQSIIVYYKYTVVVLTRELYNGVMANKIIFNKTVVNPGFKKDGISIYMLGINMVVEIPEIGATITFSGLIFSVKLPFSKFGNNTEGQCGTCSNTKIDDCRLPSGKIISSCTQMAPHWKVNDDKKRYCVGTTPPPSTPTPAPSCPPSALCKIILSEVFEECHKVIPPQDFYKGCVFDACHMTNASMQCSGLEIYATLCATRGVCIDWRGETQGKCPYNCPVGKVYKPCGPLNPATCDSRAVQHNGTGLTEGCFCPEGKFLFNANSDVCVSGCGNCIGPDGQPKLPGDQWKSNCQDCVCDRYTVTVQCTKRPCKPLPPVSCDDPGFVPVQSLTQEDPCCVQTECRCDTSKCPESVASCQPGYELIPEVLNGNCCTIFTCKLKPGCVTNGTFYMPGAVIPKGTCEKCTCSAKVQPDSQRNIVDCQPIPCDTECPLGYEYKMKSGQCCGKCVQVACVLKMKDNTVHVLQAGKVWHEPGDNCTFYKCEQIEDQFIPVTVRKACQPIYPEDCDPADIKLSEDGCCKRCIPQGKVACKLHSTPTVIRHNECNSSVPVELTYCEGNCDTSSMYSLEANVMQHKCKCCQEVKTSKRQVTLSCPDGSTTDYSYTHVEQCDCAGTECIPQAPPTTPAQQQEQEQQQQEQIQQQQGQS